MIKERIIIVDVLRGFALLLIVLIHSVEHFEFYTPPKVNFLFSSEFDRQIFDSVLLLISGKAYSIFALLFGLSFYIQMDSKAQKNINYRWGFVWRMCVLFIIGLIHSLIFRGDILHIYAILSLAIVSLYKVKINYLWIIAVLLFIQIPTIYNLVQSFLDPDAKFINPLSVYWREGRIAYSSGSFKEVVQYNLWQGRSSVYSWCYGNGRFIQLIGLFIVGLILGRNKVFHQIDHYRKQLLFVLTGSVVVIFALSIVRTEIDSSELLGLQKRLIGILLSSYSKLAATAGITALIILLYLKAKDLNFFKLLSAYGKMSLSNYVFQSVLGVLFFYHFGLGMFRYLGSAWSLLLGILVFYLQAIISQKWNDKYYYGPLEWFWRCCTKLDFSIKLKR